jgi:hypothetical protein
VVEVKVEVGQVGMERVARVVAGMVGRGAMEAEGWADGCTNRLSLLQQVH